ncbi:hypothetical protein GQ53DRAFT_867352 [Thozetella sp. PMI_491]|nr:hypothetical protein GQ53DRAFT_867352 [Thozetella sp. PMI_491]
MGIFGGSKKKTETIANLEAEVLRLQAALSSHAARAAQASATITGASTSFNSSDANLSQLRSLQQQVDQLRRENAHIQEELRRSNNVVSSTHQHLQDAYHQMDVLWDAHKNEVQILKTETERKETLVGRAIAERAEEREEVIKSLIQKCNDLTTEKEELVEAARAMANESRSRSDVLSQERDRLKEAVAGVIKDVDLRQQKIREQTVALAKKDRDLKEREREVEALRVQQQHLFLQLEEQGSSMAEKTRSLEEAERQLESSRAEQRRLSQQLEEQDSERQGVILERNRIRVDLGASQRRLEDSKKEGRMKDAKLEFLQQLIVAKSHGLPAPTKSYGVHLIPRPQNGAVVSRQVSTPALRGQDGTDRKIMTGLSAISESTY